MKFSDLSRGDYFIVNRKEKPNLYFCLPDGWAACMLSTKYPSKVGKVFRFNPETEVTHKDYKLLPVDNWRI